MPTHQMNSTTHHQYQSGAALKNVIISLFLASGLFVMAWMMLPTAFSTDLERIGQGKPAIVLIYDMENGSSLDLMKGYNAIRHDYEHLVDFFVADVESPKGKVFIRTYKATPGSAIYFLGNGEKTMVLYGSQDENVLIESIKKTFGS